MYRTYSWLEYRDAAREIACGLRRLGIRKGDLVASYSETRAEFYLMDLGILGAGAISAALYTSLPVPQLLPNLRASHPGLIVTEDADGMRKLRQGAGGEKLAEKWIVLTGEAEGAFTLEQVRNEGRSALAQDPELFERMQAEILVSDPAILYLTSGATGEPKMGLVQHGALVANMDIAPEILGFTPEDRTIVFLPSAHIAQRFVLELLPIRMGVQVWFSESLTKLPHELKTIRPTFFLAPPRVWERMYASIFTELRKRTALSRKLFYGALGIGSEVSRLRQANKPVPRALQRLFNLANRLVFSKIRERLGGQIRIAASGAAPLGKELAEFFAAIGMPLVEGYGLTEGGIVTLNPLDRPKPGSIGKPLPRVEVRLAEDGELMVRSPFLFSGYMNDPEATAAVLREGWLATGDIAEIDAEGYVYITGRKKDLIVSSNGKKIYPARIENLFKTEPLINQVLLIGDRLPYVTALFTLNAANAQTLEGMQEWKDRSPAGLAAAQPVQERMREAVKRANAHLADFERIRKFRILERDFSIESGELTPTMKVRRSYVLENFRSTVTEMYAGKEESQ